MRVLKDLLAAEASKEGLGEASLPFEASSAKELRLGA